MGVLNTIIEDFLDDYLKPLNEKKFEIPEWANDDEDDESTENQSQKDITAKADEFYGRCVLSIKFENKYEYEKWLKYHPDRKWEFLVSYPAIMRATYEFHTKQDVEILASKIIQLLQMGFQVYSADWQLKQYKSQLDTMK